MGSLCGRLNDSQTGQGLRIGCRRNKSATFQIETRLRNGGQRARSHTKNDSDLDELRGGVS
jgi:hypothetical protein